MEGPAQDYLTSQHLMSRKIKIKGSPLSIDLDQVEVTTEKAEKTIVKTTESNNQDFVGGMTTNQGSFPSLGGMTTLKTCVASCILKEITPPEIATPSMSDTQEKIIR